MQITEDRIFTRVWVVKTLTHAKGMTLGELDSAEGAAHLFDNVKPGNKGIAGDVMEQSVFKYKKDRKQQADILVDDVLTELKTTGVRIPSELKEEADNPQNNRTLYFEAKEPVSITAVSVDCISEEEFLTSHFWEKTQHILFVLYEYDSPKPVKAKEYARFKVVDFTFNEFCEEDKIRLQHDWLTVHEFVKNAKAMYGQDQTALFNQYKLLSTLRSSLRLVDLAPRYSKKTKPRFRLKQTFVTSIVRKFFENSIHKEVTEDIKLDEPIIDYSQIDLKCHGFASKYAGKDLSLISKELGVEVNLDIKNFGEQIILRMFGVAKGKLNQIEDFQKLGIVAKSIPMYNDGNAKEDMKLFQFDKNDCLEHAKEDSLEDEYNTSLFEDSELYRYFSERNFIFILFRYKKNRNEVPNGYQFSPEEIIFEGFKRYSFTDFFIDKFVKLVWKDARSKIKYHKLRIVKSRRGYAPNFIKQGITPKNLNKLETWSKSYHPFFIRGGAKTSEEKYKTMKINGHKMIPQYYWIDNSYLLYLLNSIDYL